MTKIETPKENTDKENPFVKEGKLDTELIAKFQEALQSDAGKEYDIVKEFKLTAVPDKIKPDTTTSTEDQAAKDLEQKKWISIYENAHEALKDTGYKFENTEPQTSKMSEAQVAVNERIEKIAEVKFMEAKSSVLAADKDFPVEILDKLTGMQTEDKALVMAAFKEVADRTVETTKKLQEELTTATTKLEDPKFSSPKETGPKTGKEKVEAMRAHFGIQKEKETEVKKD